MDIIGRSGRSGRLRHQNSSSWIHNDKIENSFVTTTTIVLHQSMFPGTYCGTFSLSHILDHRLYLVARKSDHRSSGRNAQRGTESFSKGRSLVTTVWCRSQLLVLVSHRLLQVGSDFRPFHHFVPYLRSWHKHYRKFEGLRQATLRTSVSDFVPFEPPCFFRRLTKLASLLVKVSILCQFFFNC